MNCNSGHGMTNYSSMKNKTKKETKNDSNKQPCITIRNSIITFAPHFHDFFLHFHPFPWISLRWVLQKGTRLLSPLLPWRIAYVMLSIDVDIDMKLTLGCKHQQFESKKSIWTYFTDMLGIELLTCYMNWIISVLFKRCFEGFWSILHGLGYVGIIQSFFLPMSLQYMLLTHQSCLHRCDFLHFRWNETGFSTHASCRHVRSHDVPEPWFGMGLLHQYGLDLWLQATRPEAKFQETTLVNSVTFLTPPIHPSEMSRWSTLTDMVALRNKSKTAKAQWSTKRSNGLRNAENLKSETFISFCSMPRLFEFGGPCYFRFRVMIHDWSDWLCFLEWAPFPVGWPPKDWCHLFWRGEGPRGTKAWRISRATCSPRGEISRKRATWRRSSCRGGSGSCFWGGRWVELDSRD